MRFEQTKLPGAWIVDISPLTDHRGLFARTFCHQEFESQQLISNFVQCNVSFNTHKGTLRGMHIQREPFAEGKLVRCTSGVIYDVIVDLRPDVPTFCKWLGVELSAENRRALYIPPGFAHGFVTLTEGAEVFYQMTEYYHQDHASGVRWNDPAFGITWPLNDPIISENDAAYPDFKP